MPTLMAAATAHADVEVQFEADLRAEIVARRFDPAQNSVGLRGSCGPLSWSRSLPMTGLGDGRYTLTLQLSASAQAAACGGQPLQHKFRIERAGQGGDEGWEPGSNHAVQLDGPGPFRVARLFGAAPVPVPSRRAGTVLLLDAVPTTHVLPRPVFVWLPPGYERDTAARYPVLYLHDGQNVFDALASGAEWQVDENAQRLVLAGEVMPFIVVAIPSDRGGDRIRELTPTAMVLPPDGSGGLRLSLSGGGLAAYARFLIEDLKPVVDARFRTRRGPQSTAVGGSSLGGLASLWLALHHGNTFGAALVVSPSVWWDDEFMLRDPSLRRPALPRPRLWLDIGLQEGERAVDGVRRLRDALRERGWSAADLAYTEDPEGRHDEASWARRVEGMLRFLHGSAPRR